VDGNKRTGLAAGALFLELNGHVLASSNELAVVLAQRIALGRVTPEEIAAWLREHSRPATAA